MKALEAIRQFDEYSKVCWLATVDGEQPRVRPMGSALFDAGAIWFATSARSEKIRQLAINPNVEICYIDLQWSHLRIRGQARQVAEPTMRQRVWENAPELRQFFTGPDDADMVLLRVDIADVRMMTMRDGKYQKLDV